MLLTQTQAIEVVTAVGPGGFHNDTKISHTHGERAARQFRMRILVLEVAEEVEEVGDAFPPVFDLHRPGSRVLEGFIVAPENFLLHVADASVEQITAGPIESADELGPEAPASCVQ